jgi:hypothetical protein
MLNISEIRALIALLDDQDEDVIASVQNRIREYGEAVLPELERTLTTGCGIYAAMRLNALVSELRGSDARKELADWLDSGCTDTLRGMYCVAHFCYPTIKFDEINRQFSEILNPVLAKVNAKHSALQKVNIVTRALFEKYKFSNNYLLGYDAESHFIHQILDSRKVNPISLTLLYMCFGERLGITMKLINLPGNYILFCDKQFYVNPTFNGDIFGMQRTEPFLPPTPMRSMELADISCADSVQLLFHSARAARREFIKQNTRAGTLRVELASQLEPVLQAFAEKMDISKWDW